MDGDESEQNSNSFEQESPRLVQPPPSYLNLIPHQKDEQEPQAIVVKPQTQIKEVNNTVKQSVEPQILVQTTQRLTQVQMPQQTNISQQQIIQSQQQIDAIQQQIQMLQQQVDMPLQQVKIPQQQIAIPQQQIVIPQQQIMQIMPQQQVQIHDQQQQVQINQQQQIKNSQQEIQDSQIQVESKKNSGSDSFVEKTKNSPWWFCLYCPIVMEAVLGIISILVGLVILGIFGLIIYTFVLMVQCPYSAVFPVLLTRPRQLFEGNWVDNCEFIYPSFSSLGAVVNIFSFACMLLLGAVIGFVLAFVSALFLCAFSYAFQACNNRIFKEGDYIGRICALLNFVLNCGNAFFSLAGVIFCCVCCPIWCCGTCCAFCCCKISPDDILFGL